MKNINKIKNDFLNTALVCSSFLFSMPNIGNCIPSKPITIFNPSPADFDSIIYNLFNHASRGDLEGIELQLKNIAEMLEQSDDALTDSCQFLKDLVSKMNAQYGTTLTLSELLQITRESIDYKRINASISNPRKSCRKLHGWIGFDRASSIIII